MLLNRSNPRSGKNKKYIKESDVKGAVVEAISEAVPSEVLDKLRYEIKNSRNPFDLVDKVARVIRRRLDDIVDLVISNLDLTYRLTDRGYEVYYYDTLEKKEIPFDVHLTKEDYKAKDKDPVDILLDKSKDFLRKVFDEDDLAEAFAHVFVEFVATPDKYVFDKFTPEYEREQAERRMKGFEERTRRYRKNKLEELFEREPAEEELRRIEESGDIDKLSEEDLEDYDPWDFPM